MTSKGPVIGGVVTLLSLSHSPDHEFHESYYLEIRRIALYSTICLTISILVLLMLVVPMDSAEGVPGGTYAIPRET